MRFVEFVAVVRRRKIMVVLGAAFAVAVAVLSSYSFNGTKLVSRSRPVFEATAVVAVQPGARIVPTDSAAAATVPTTIAPVLAPDPTAVVGAAPTSVGPTTTTRPVASDVVRSDELYYAALSIQTAVQSPGFSEQVRAAAPTMDGSLSAVVPLDTNTIRLVMSGSSPSRVAESLNAAIAQIQQLVSFYSTSDAFVFALEADVISGPSTPSAVRSIKGPVTAMVVLIVLLVAVWMLVRAVDQLKLHRLENEQRRSPDGARRRRELRLERAVRAGLDGANNDGAAVEPAFPPPPRR